MWANTVWGLAGLSFSCLLGLLSMSDPYWQGRLYIGALVFALASFLVLVWPILSRLVRYFLSFKKPVVSAPAVTMTITEWRKPREAVEEFAEAILLNAKNKWENTLSDSFDRQFKAEKNIDELEKRMAKAEGEDVTSRLGDERRRLRGATMVIPHAEDELRRIWATIREDMGKKLENRVLIAKGLIAPHVPGNGEIEIPPHEWRILELNPTDETAIGKGDYSVKYLGIMIGKPI